MFSSTLRKKPLWNKLGPALASSTLASFKESPMTSTDLTITVQSNQKQTAVHVILLNTVDISSGEAASRLDSLSSAVRPANDMDVVMLVHDASDPNTCFRCILQLQNLLLDHTSVVSLPVSSAEKIIPTLEVLVSRLREPLHKGPTRPPLASQVIAHVTTSAPTRLLNEDQTHVISRLFPSIKDLEKGTRTVEGRAQIRNYLEPATARDVIDFWEDEWVV